MSKRTEGFPRRRVPGLVIAVALASVATGCQRPTPPATDSKSLQKHADELKKQHEREMKNQ